MNKPLLKDRLVAFLKISGKYFSKDIEKHLECSGVELRQIIHELRDAGVPIGSSTDNGYWYAFNKEQLESTIEWYRNKAVNHLRIADKLESIYKKKEKFQEELF